MNLIIVAVLATIASSKALQENPLLFVLGTNGEESDKARIIGGQEAIPHSIPYQAFLTIWTPSSREWHCGGSIISAKVILTAAHCLYSGSSAKALLGAHNRANDESTQQTVYSAGLVIHPNYNPSTLLNDIGLVLLNSSITFTPSVQKVILPSIGDNSNYENRRAKISGWGSTSCSSIYLSSVLRFVRVITTGSCVSLCPVINCPVICTVGANGGMPFYGDDGGPLVDTRSGKQIGIYSSSSCTGSVQSKYTRVTAFRTWIELFL